MIIHLVVLLYVFFMISTIIYMLGGGMMSSFMWLTCKIHQLKKDGKSSHDPRKKSGGWCPPKKKQFHPPLVMIFHPHLVIRSSFSAGPCQQWPFPGFPQFPPSDSSVHGRPQWQRTIWVWVNNASSYRRCSPSSEAHHDKWFCHSFWHLIIYGLHVLAFYPAFYSGILSNPFWHFLWHSISSNIWSSRLRSGSAHWYLEKEKAPLIKSSPSPGRVGKYRITHKSLRPGGP